MQVLALSAGLLCGLSAASPALAQAAAVDAKVCDVVNHPKQWDGKTVRLTGLVQIGFDSFLMRGDTCSSVLWLSYPAGTKAKAGPATVLTLQLAANSAGTPGTARPAVTLTQDKDFQTFDALLSAKPKTTGMCLGCVKNDVTATLVGRIDGTENPGLQRDKDGKITSLDGFGNMNQYGARLVIESVSNPVAKELDYSKTPKISDDNQGGSGKDYMALARKSEDAFGKGAAPGGQIEAALQAFGAPGQDNGVEISFGDTADVPEGEGTKSAKSSPDGLLLEVRFDSDKLKGDTLSRAIAHQGEEIVMLRDKTTSGAMAIELKAWQVALLVTIGSRQKTLTLPGGTVLWNSAWPQAESSADAGAALTVYLGDREETPR